MVDITYRGLGEENKPFYPQTSMTYLSNHTHTLNSHFPLIISNLKSFFMKSSPNAYEK